MEMLYCFTSQKFRNNMSDNTIFTSDIEIGKAVRASCSYPVVFSPCPYKNIKLVDGGIRENVPWKELKFLGADKVVNIVFEDEGNEVCNKNLVEVNYAESSRYKTTSDTGLHGRIQLNAENESTTNILPGIMDFKYGNSYTQVSAENGLVHSSREEYKKKYI